MRVEAGACQTDASLLKDPVHMGGYNYLFCDGHVKWLRPEATIKTPGVDYSTSKVMTTWWNPATTTNCKGTIDFPCGMWTIDDGD